MASENRNKRINKLLTEILKPQELEVTDNSNAHAGHIGASPRGETHYKIRIRSSQFSGLDLLQQHRQIYKILEYELKNGLHALEIDSGSA